MKTGQCKFGPTCRFNHPEGVATVMASEAQGAPGSLPGQGRQQAGAGGSGELNSAGYPLNAGAQDCGFFMKTGQCKFGPTCRFNHPEGMATVMASEGQGAPGGQVGEQAEAFAWGGEAAAGSLNSAGFPLNPGQQDCQFFMKVGNCKFGATCKYNHPEGIATVVAGDGSAMAAPAGESASTNSMGFPLNPGSQDCGFYMKTGNCKFGATCKFNHPEGMATTAADGAAAATDDDALALELMGGTPGRNASGLPLNPGSADCAFYMKTGSCKFGGTCRFNHPEGIAQQIVASGVGAGGKSLNSAGYPLNPEQPDCGFFSKMGICKFGASCKWNHPEGLATAMAGDSQGQQAVMKATKAQGGAGGQVNAAGYPLNPDQGDCGFYMKTGQCKFGATCRYNHPEHRATMSAEDAAAAAGGSFGTAMAALGDTSGAWGAAEAGQAGLNSQGYPLNPGSPDCSFYVKTGQCKFGETCRFNHPESGAAGAVSSTAPGGQNGQAVNSAGYPLNPEQQDCSFYVKTGSCKFGATCRFNHPEGIAANGGGAAGQQALGNGAAGGKGGGKGRYATAESLNSAGYPLHPEQPDCSFYVKTGSCKFGSTCRFNHPENGAGGGDAGAAGGAPPSRPGQPTCTFFMKTGTCKFGQTCKFDHPAPQNGGEAGGWGAPDPADVDMTALLEGSAEQAGWS